MLLLAEIPWDWCGHCKTHLVVLVEAVCLQISKYLNIMKIHSSSVYWHSMRKNSSCFLGAKCSFLKTDSQRCPMSFNRWTLVSLSSPTPHICCCLWNQHWMKIKWFVFTVVSSIKMIFIRISLDFEIILYEKIGVY